tara:strand:- start:1308 stop:1601 length:294 start_codon:yes stop_codon:yes gene_type:complete
MRFIEILNKKKFFIVSVILFLYVFLNLLDGERGLISFFEKKNLIKQLEEKKIIIAANLKNVEKKNNLLTGSIDLDYLETLYRSKFMVGRPNEKIYID